MAALAAPAAAHAQTVPVVQPGPLTVAQVEAAASATRADPDLGGTRRDMRWRLKPSDDEPRRKRDDGSFWRDLGRWLGSVTQVLVWVAGALALALLVVFGRRWWRGREGTLESAEASLPTHVGTLDIRPESLPEDVAAAVWALWRGDQPRAALSLLYRAALSRLVQRRLVAVDAATTEGECLERAHAALPAASRGYLATLVAAWQMTGYAGRRPGDATVEALCRGFDAWLAPTSADTPPMRPEAVA